jgi:hypothetical protein
MREREREYQEKDRNNRREMKTMVERDGDNGGRRGFILYFFHLLSSLSKFHPPFKTSKQTLRPLEQGGVLDDESPLS